ncbi:hypothetical protein [Cupriavidus pauculus]|uniref:hypothetical protein n=1 Tax=Cupriavidus pauculus TaxID=82633 RepID=UPI0038572DFA
MPIYRDFKKGDARRDFLVLITLATKRTIPAVAVELEMSKSECTLVVSRFHQYGVELEKDGSHWNIKNWGVLNERAVVKLLAEFDPANEPVSAPKAPAKKVAKKAVSSKKIAPTKKTPAKKTPAKKAATKPAATSARKRAATLE